MKYFIIKININFNLLNMNGLDVTKIRKDLKLTQDEFGKLIGVDKRTVINYEQGKTIPKSKVNLLELMLANGMVSSNTAVQLKKEIVPSVNTKNLLDDIESLKDHIKTLKDLVTEKTKLSEMYINENAMLRETIKTLTKNDD
jgi:DNA-binding XRE family transcriptional regulator